MSDFRGYVYQQLINNGATDEGASGLLGNIQAESGILSNRLQGDFTTGYVKSTAYTEGVNNGSISRDTFVHDSKGYGLAQWTSPGRKEALYDYCMSHSGNISSIQDQVGFLIYELQTSYSSTWNIMINSHDMRAVSDFVLHNFERPKDQSEAVEKYRYKLALALYNALHGLAPIIDPGEPIFPQDFEYIPTTQKYFNIIPFLADYGIIYKGSTNDWRTRY